MNEVRMAGTSSGTGKVRFKAPSFSGVKIFSATMMNERAALGDLVTKWIHDNPALELHEIVVTQSSDEAFHCVTLTVFYLDTSV